MKYAFILVLLIIGAAAGLLVGAAAYHWIDNMTQTPRIVPGERVFEMPKGSIPRGAEAVIPKEQRDVAAKLPNPIKSSEQSVTTGRDLYRVYCVPCHGVEAKGGVTGLVATKFIPTPDLTNAALQKQRTDGFWHSYIVVGGAVMPA
ncbi:MAG: c-type cytochrome, partial [Candidatus Rokuibacteriota bacterium]